MVVVYQKNHTEHINRLQWVEQQCTVLTANHSKCKR